jgi:short-subunit dehydrogenase
MARRGGAGGGTGTAALKTGLAAAGALALAPHAGHALQHLMLALRKPQNLRSKYNAQWALVTGASSGIGYAATRALASQGLGIIAVALDEPALDNAMQALRRDFPGISFRRVGVSLADNNSSTYMTEIESATSDIDVQIVVNNAGFVVTGFFDRTPIAKNLACAHCNAVAPLPITYHFVSKMLNKQQRGCVIFTSSAAACFPSPFSSLYAATKSFLSFFGAALNVELRSRGIDVCVVHPSPVSSRFYDNAHSISALDFFKSVSGDPSAVPKAMLKAVGRASWMDVGLVALLFRSVSKLLDLGHIFTVVSAHAHRTADYRKYVGE